MRSDLHPLGVVSSREKEKGIGQLKTGEDSRSLLASELLITCLTRRSSDYGLENAEQARLAWLEVCVTDTRHD